MSGGFRIASVEPTVFFVRGEGGGLLQLCRLTVENPGVAADGTVVAHAGAAESVTRLGLVPTGTTTTEVTLPDVRLPAPVTLVLKAAGERQDAKTVPWLPERHWECHLVHGSHHDIGYTDIPSNVLREHAAHLDQVVQFCEETASWPDESRFRYAVEQAWSALYHLESRPPEARERLLRLMRSGDVELTALFANETSELCGHEEQVRLLYPAFRAARRHGIPVTTAELNDIPGVSWGLVSVLAGAGIKYFAPGIQDYFGWGRKVRPIWDEAEVLPRDMLGAFTWEGADGSRVLFWYGGAAIETLELWTAAQAARDLPAFLGGLARRGYPHEVIRIKVLGGRRDNSPPDLRFSRIAREWNERWAFPRLVTSTNARFFSRLEASADGEMRVLRGDLPNTDYPIGATSRARDLAVNRRTHETLAQAEKLAAWAATEADAGYPADALAEACEAVLIGDEHTGGMAHPAGPAQEACWSWKGERAWRGAALAHDVLVKSANTLADRVGLGEEGCHLVVFNTLGHERTDLVRVRAYPPEPAGSPMHWLDRGPGEPQVLVSGRAAGRSLTNLPAELLERPFRLVDVETGETVSAQVLTLGDPLAPIADAAELYSLGHTSQDSHEALNFGRAHLLELVFVARGVPALGFRSYRIEPAAAWSPGPAAPWVGDRSLENRFYRVELDPVTGAARSIRDKRSGREWVDQGAAWGVGELLSRSPPTAEARRPTCSGVEPGEAGPVLASLVVRGRAEGCPWFVQEITLYADLERIDFATRVLRDATPLLEHHVAFPFALRSPRFRYEIANAVVEPVTDQLPGTNTDAATVQHWVSVSDAEGTITWASLDAPVVAVGGLRPSPVSQAHHAVAPSGFGSPWQRDPAELRDGHIYSFVMDNNFRTNFQASQVADVLFRYSVTASGSALDRSAAAAFGWGAATPLTAACVRGPREGPLGASGSFCSVEGEGVLLLAVKAAEDGDGLVLRVADASGVDRTAVLRLPGVRIHRATSATLVEDDRGDLEHDEHAIHVPLAANGLATVRVRDGRRHPTPSQLTWLG